MDECSYCVYYISREQEYQLTKRLKETERTRQEEAHQMQDRVSTAINALQEKVDQLKGGTSNNDNGYIMILNPNLVSMRKCTCTR